MKKILSLCLFIICISAYGDVCATTHINRVIDGDTLEIPFNCNCFPKKLKLSVRVRGVDTPEHGAKAKCPSEAALGDKATAFTANLVKNANYTAVISNMEWDKYGGRIDATVTLNGIDLTQALIKAGLGHPYNGGKKIPWCAKA